MFNPFPPDAGDGGLDFLLEAGDQFAVGGDQRLLGFYLGDDGLLGGEAIIHWRTASEEFGRGTRCRESWGASHAPRDRRRRRVRCLFGKGSFRG